jgi:hypothetical protein
MDILLILYSILFFLILVFPFLWFHKRVVQDSKKSQRGELKEKRSLLMENLKDLKTDMETGKLSREELEMASEDIVKSLEAVDQELLGLQEIITHCKHCKKEINLDEAKFCAYCGKLLLTN